MAEGIIRTPRRPEGWSPPGPAPLGDQGDPSLRPAEDEDLCLLSGDWRIFQKVRGNRWSLDDLVTAWVATQGLSPDEDLRAVDLGCGIGSVLQMVAWRLPRARCVGVEAQDVSIALARRSVRFNGAAPRVELRHGDLRDPATLDDLPPFALVTGTPPYFPPGTGLESARVQTGPCRFEHRGGVEAYAEAAARVLAPGGRFAMVVGGLEIDRALDAVTAASLHPRAVWRVLPKPGRAPRIAVLLSTHEPGPTDAVELVVRDEGDQWTDAFRAVRRDMGLPPDPPRRTP
jgi:tRNA1(Val) A37 N6-methylase TrmN6